MKVTKSFNTVVSQNDKIIYNISPKKELKPPFVLTKKLPKDFNPFDLNNKSASFITPPRTQGSCGNCFAQASVTSLSDRFSIFTQGYINVIMSTFLPTICDGILQFRNLNKQIVEQKNISSHSSAACTGNTIHNIMEYLYKFGSVSAPCFDNSLLKYINVKSEKDIESPVDLPYCQKVLGQNYGTCLDGLTPAIFYRAISFYNVFPSIEYIKNEIYHWGPVVTGMIVYDSFLNPYDGTTIYMGPIKGDTNQGGHAIKLVGWGKDNGIEYFWAENSWSSSWGILGYFKIKCDVCDIMNNVMACFPDIPGFPLEILDYKSISTDDMEKERNDFGVDNVTGYKISILKNSYYKGTLQFDLGFKNIIDILPDYKNVWAGEITSGLPIKMYFQENNKKLLTINNLNTILWVIFISVILPIFLGYFFSKHSSK